MTATTPIVGQPAATPGRAPTGRSLSRRQAYYLPTALVFVVISVALYAVSRLGVLSPERLLDLGLLYEVFGGFAVVLGTSAGMVWDPHAHILGLSWISVWIVGFPFVIPKARGWRRSACRTWRRCRSPSRNAVTACSSSTRVARTTRTI